MKDKHIGSDFNDFLFENGIYEEVDNLAIKKMIAYEIEAEMKAQNITKTKMAEAMHTSRAVVDRLLNPHNNSLTLATLQNAVNILGKKLSITIS